MTEKNCLGFILIRTDLGKENEVLEEIQKLPETEYVEQTAGCNFPDLIAKVSTESQNHFNGLITDIRNNISNIRSTLTLLVA
jgi:DNA-binding Lrp family transcriptional regulator